MSKIKIFPIPYAGASVNVYYAWKKLLPEAYELCLIELAGKGGRFNDSFYQSVDEAARDIAKRIKEKLNSDDEYVIFGHSMGALLAYEVYYELQKLGAKAPRHLFVSGRKAPHCYREKENMKDLDNKAFMEMVDKFGGIPKEFYTEEVMKMFLPILRSDFIILDQYEHHLKSYKINCEMSVFYADNDFSTPEEEVDKWKELSEGNVKFYKFEGEHFFLNDCPEKIVDLIVNNTKQ